jgi:surface antigen
MQKRNTGVIAGLVMGLGLALALATGLSAPSAQAQNTSFLQKRPISRLSEGDRKLFDEALRTLLASDDANAEATWENPASGSRGTLKTVQVEKVSPDYGVECRTLQVHNEVKGVAGDSRTRLCKSKDGEWRLAPKSKKK